MIAEQDSAIPRPPAQLPVPAKNVNLLKLRKSSIWHDPLRLIQIGAPGETARIVSWVVSAMVILLGIWSIVGQLDIIVTAEGRLTPHSLVQVVQPADGGIIRELLIKEGDHVRQGQVLARLDATAANADVGALRSELAMQHIQVRRVLAEIQDLPFRREAGEGASQFSEALQRFESNQRAFKDSLAQEKSLLLKAGQEMRSAVEIEAKLEKSLPNNVKVARVYAELEHAGFFPALTADEKRRELMEKEQDLAAQKATVAALAASIAAQEQKIRQLKSGHDSQLQRELGDLRSRILQLQPELDKASYREGLLSLKAPQDGIIVDLATTTVGAVLRPGEVLVTLVPSSEPLYANVNIRNEDVGFVRPGQEVQVKLAAYPFQKYGMLRGRVVQVGADVSSSTTGAVAANPAQGNTSPDRTSSGGSAPYKARVELVQQFLDSPAAERLQLTPGMQVSAEINQGKRSVLDYLLSPVKKVAQEAGRER